MLIDGCGRKITYLRISLTDKCNLRCRYCVPPEGVTLLEHKDVLTLEEILRVATLLTGLGVNKIRFTGGEPLVRKGALSLIRDAAKISDDTVIGLTTNGVLLRENLPALIEAGVRDINISLDTLRRDVYESITGHDALDDVLDSIEKCIEYNMNVKINCVPLKGINEDDLIKLALMARENDIAVRFIELMPIGCAGALEGMSNDDVRRMLSDWLDEEKEVDPEISFGPASYVTYEGFKGRVGFISPMSHAFCSTCNRIRLTCEGKLKLCLASSDNLDLRALLRNGASDEQISSEIIKALQNKPSHHGFNDVGYSSDGRNMICIGG